jgi:hypothetical protein
MSYIQQSLTKGEHVVLQARISWWSQFPLIVLGLLFLAMLRKFVSLASHSLVDHSALPGYGLVVEEAEALIARAAV